MANAWACAVAESHELKAFDSLGVLARSKPGLLPLLLVLIGMLIRGELYYHWPLGRWLLLLQMGEQAETRM